VQPLVLFIKNLIGHALACSRISCSSFNRPSRARLTATPRARFANPLRVNDREPGIMLLTLYATGEAAMRAAPPHTHTRANAYM
jgi:hypothetical protein